METRFLFTKAVYEPSPFGVKFAGGRHIFTRHVDVH